MTSNMDTRDAIAKAIADAIPSFVYVNIGIGLPTRILPFLSSRHDVMAHTENGAVGAVALPEGTEWDGVSVDPGKHPMGYREGASMFDSFEAFRLIHSGNLDLSIMGAYQVSSGGDLANWSRPGAGKGAIGGAADLAVGASEVWIGMQHTGPNGEPRLVDSLSYPVTSRGCVTRIFTELGEFVPNRSGFDVTAVAQGVGRSDIENATRSRLSWHADPSAATIEDVV